VDSFCELDCNNFDYNNSPFRFYKTNINKENIQIFMIKLIQNWNATMEWLAVHEPRILEIVPQELPCNRKEGILLSRYLILKLFDF